MPSAPPETSNQSWLLVIFMCCVSKHMPIMLVTTSNNMSADPFQSYKKLKFLP